MRVGWTKHKLYDGDEPPPRPQKRAGMRRHVNERNEILRMMKESSDRRRLGNQAVPRSAATHGGAFKDNVESVECTMDRAQVVFVRSNDDRQSIKLRGFKVRSSSETFVMLFAAKRSVTKNSSSQVLHDRDDKVICIPAKSGEIIVHVHEFFTSSFAKNFEHHKLIVNSSEPAQWAAFSIWGAVAMNKRIPDGQTAAALQLSIGISKFLGSPERVFKVLNHALAFASQDVSITEKNAAGEVYEQALQSGKLGLASKNDKYTADHVIRFFDTPASLDNIFQASCPLKHLDTTYEALETTLPILAQLLDFKSNGTLPQSDGIVYRFNPNSSKAQGPYFEGRVVCWQEYLEHAWTRSDWDTTYAPRCLDTTQNAIMTATLLDASADCMDLLLRYEEQLLSKEASLLVPELDDETSGIEEYFGEKSSSGVEVPDAPASLNQYNSAQAQEAEESESSEEE
ncbi:hypothetical protein N431DRAFT_472951 [Stipitochalara longipes BDJ]|nr:hypothetical protein N431DRAFT_472951 [Stipitochalara longipes BDJ]